MQIIPSNLISSSQVLTCFTTRHGGVSQKPFDTLNLAFHVNDNTRDVIANHTLLARTLGYDVKKLVHMRQIHSDHIVVVNEQFNFDTPPQCDALITNISSLPLMVMSADCTPILIYDPLHHAIGAVHAGRTGALNGILTKTIQKMLEIYGSNPEELHIVLGPSICGSCYEINESIAQEVHTKGYTQSLKYKEEKVFLDVNTILIQQLEVLGVKHYEVSPHCTSCSCGDFFSYRVCSQYTGRIAGVIMLW
jgi:hypothetical protein